MPAWNSRPIAFAFLAILLGGPAAADASRAAWVHATAIDPDIPGSVLQRVDEALGEELTKILNLMPDAELQAFQRGGAQGADVDGVNKLSAEAKRQILAFDPSGALKTLAQAREELQPKLLQLRDYQPLVDVLLYTGAAALSAGKTRDSQESFAELARLRPDYRIDAASFPPAVIAAFEKARQADVKIPRGRVEVSSVPPAQLYVDELARGQTPVTAILSPGKHVLRLEANGFGGWTEQVMIEPYSKLAKKVTLEWSRAAADLQQLKADVEAGALAPKILEDGAHLAASLGVQGVVTAALGLSREGFVVSVASLPASGAGHVAVTQLDRRFKDLPEAVRLCAKTLATEKPSPDFKLVPRVVGSERPTRALDFARYGLGLEPGMTALSLGAPAPSANPVSQAPAAHEGAKLELWPHSGGQVLARWKGGTITADQLADRMKQYARTIGVQSLTPSQRRQAWEGLLQTELLAEEAIRQGALADPSFAPGLKAALAKRLLEKEIDENAQRKNLSEKELRDYYDTHRAEFRQDGKDSSFEQVSDALRTRLSAARRGGAIDQYVAGLKTQANVEIESKDLEKALSAPAAP